MPALLHLVELITSDSLTLAASGILAAAVLALLVLIAWPARGEARRDASRHPRAVTARALAASGIAPVDIARRTGLSRDALALLTGLASPAARQKAPTSARPSLFQRLLGKGDSKAMRSQVTV
ncbi:MAG: hypothetical protein ABI910_06165 [Gemmatimonadota bacterium]